jgi:peroxiredoxin Q/BCP
MAVALNKKVPDFRLPSSSGEDFKLSKHAGETVVLYFYPKDNTPGCTLEGQEFNKLLSSFKKLGVTVYGVSRDALKSHGRFIEKCGFKFDLLSDEDEKVCDLFDVIKEKNFYGKKIMGIERSTFVVNGDQKLVGEFRKVKAEGHAQEVLNFIKNL